MAIIYICVVCDEQTYNISPRRFSREIKALRGVGFRPGWCRRYGIHNWKIIHDNAQSLLSVEFAALSDETIFITYAGRRGIDGLIF